MRTTVCHVWILMQIMDQDQDKKIKPDLEECRFGFIF